MKAQDARRDKPPRFIEHRFPTQDGIDLWADAGGDPDALPVVLLRGGTADATFPVLVGIAAEVEPEDLRRQLQAAARTLGIAPLLVRGANSHRVGDDRVADMRAAGPHAENDAYHQAVIECLPACAPPRAGVGL